MACARALKNHKKQLAKPLRPNRSQQLISAYKNKLLLPIPHDPYDNKGKVSLGVETLN